MTRAPDAPHPRKAPSPGCGSDALRLEPQQAEASGAELSPEVEDWCELTLTQKCNQRCFFCYEDGRDVARDPPFSEVQRLLRDTRRRARQVVLCGKEVLLRKDIVDIVGFAASIGLRTVVFTNGQALARPGLVDALAAAGCASVTLSFHFPDRETFARGTRTHPKGFERQLDGMRALAAYHRGRPGAALGVSTETDMSALNAGRLAGMRATLQEALAGVPWRMRIASLMPCRAHDIGLRHALTPMVERRDELAEFLATHPPELPLDFVKLPLCLLPAEATHRSLDVKYVCRGTLLTFNHREVGTVEPDTVSPSMGRAHRAVLAGHPYRWVCRACELAPMCRFEQVDWHHRWFEPIRSAKPRPPDISAAQVLARCGADAGARGRIEELGRALRRTPFPEETILASLRRGAATAPVLTDAYVDGAPILTLELEWRGSSVALRLEPPSSSLFEVPLQGIVRYVPVRVAGSAPVTPTTLVECRRALAAAEWPPMDAWAESHWFELDVAQTLERAWRRFGERLWVGSGSFGAFSTSAVRVTRDGGLRIEVAHREHPGVALDWMARRGRPDSLRLLLRPGREGRAAQAALRELVASLRALYGPERVVAEKGVWAEPEPSAPRPLTELSSPPAPPGWELVFEARDPVGTGAWWRFHVADHQPLRRCLRTVGDLDLWYTSAAGQAGPRAGSARLDRRAAALARILVLACERFGNIPRDEEAFETWRGWVAAALGRADASLRLDWHVRWVRPAAPERSARRARGAEPAR